MVHQSRTGQARRRLAQEQGEAVEHNDNVRLRPPRHRVDRRALGWWTLQSSLFALPLPLTLGILWAATPPTRTFFMCATLISLVPGILYVAVIPAWRYRVHRWEATDEAVYAASGWLWRQWRGGRLFRAPAGGRPAGPPPRTGCLS